MRTTTAPKAMMRNTFFKQQPTGPKGMRGRTGICLFVALLWVLAPQAWAQSALRVNAAGEVVGTTATQKQALRESIVGTPTAVGEVNEVWMSVRTDGLAGRGTRLDPLDASTALKFDAILDASVTGKTYRLHAGTYLTRGFKQGVGFGWDLADGATLEGSGSDRTIVRLTVYPTTWNATPAQKHYILGNPGLTSVGGCSVRDITFDCNWAGLASPWTNKAVLAAVLYGSNNLVERCRFINNYGDIASGSECFVLLFGSTTSGAAVPSQNCWAKDCMWEQPLGDYSVCVGLHGIDASRLMTHSGVTNSRAYGQYITGLANLAYVRDIDVTNNYAYVARLVYHDTGVATHVRVRDNTAVESYNPVMFQSVSGASDVDILNNSLECKNYELAGHSYGIAFNVGPFSNVTIKGNVIKRQTDGPGLDLWRGLLLDNAAGCTITDNVWSSGMDHIFGVMSGDRVARNYTETGEVPQGFYTSSEPGTMTLSGLVAFPDNVLQTFNPGATSAGLNVGANAGDPSTPTNGSLWYDSTGNLLRARVNGATVSLGTVPAPPATPTDASIIVTGSDDTSRLLRFEIDGFTVDTTRVFTWPNYNGTVATLAGVETLTNKAITDASFLSLAGGTNTSVGTFALGTITDTTSRPLLVTQTWNNAGLTATGLKVSVTDPAANAGSTAASKLLDLQGGPAGTTSVFSVGKTGTTSISGNLTFPDNLHDIGANGATRPKDYFGAGNASVAGNVTTGGILIIGAWANRIYGDAGSGIMSFRNASGNDFVRVQLGGTSGSFPGIERSGANVNIVDANSGTAGGLMINDGTPIKGVLSAAASVDFASMAAGAEDTQTLTVTGVATTNQPSVGLGFSAALEAGIVIKQVRVSAADTVSITAVNVTAGTIDPAAVTVRATALSF